ncbi:MAG: DUF4010 domain-containing protein [Xanthomonadaceae bacterium]|nr:DUF4010 domain-containing protein [Xanthomonadaceae bacterium]
MIQFLGAHAGSVFLGFFGGLISSTATTSEVARLSKVSQKTDPRGETLIFLSSTFAMLCEGIAILFLGSKDTHLSLLLIFFGPVLVTGAMIFYFFRGLTIDHLQMKDSQFSIFQILKLSAFIILILALSKILQSFFGQTGFFVLTFIASLFEMHGSVIANIQLHDAGNFGVKVLGNLVAVSLSASYLSKLFLISTMGSSTLKKQVTQCIAFLLFSLMISWLAFFLFA